MPKDNRGLAAEKLTVYAERFRAQKQRAELAEEKLTVLTSRYREMNEHCGKLRARAQAAEQLLRDLTPGGSDLQGPARCAARLRAESTELHRLVVEATARACAAEAEIKRLRLLLDDVADYAEHKPGCRGPLDVRESGRCTCGFWVMQDVVAEEMNQGLSDA